jgi:formylglycine-generating enzyme required for sulfatase activity
MNSSHATIFAIVLAAVIAHANDALAPANETITNSIGIKLVRIKSGSFPMGSPVLAVGTQEKLEYPEHRVRISRDFFLGQTEVTQSQWEAVMNTRPWLESASAANGANFPATLVSWNDAITFCKRLSAKEGVPYRLPTEAEWEYSCRAGSTSEFSFGDHEKQLRDYAWCNVSFGKLNGRHHPQKVATKRPNAWGLYDMHGNVWEWCHDRFGAYGRSATMDPTGPSEGLMRVYRGGSWDSVPSDCRSPYRRFSPPKRHFPDIGFRVARDVSAKHHENSSNEDDR